MDLYLEGKTAVVGGGSKGLGYAAAIPIDGGISKGIY